MDDEKRENDDKEQNINQKDYNGKRQRTDKKVFALSPAAKDILEWIYCIVIAIVLAVLIKYYLGTPTVVRMSSMYPTLEQSDRLILSRIDKTRKKLPERGDIITFEEPSRNIDLSEIDMENPVAKYENEPQGWWNKFVYYVLEINKTSYIKRVIGLPGEHIQIKNGKVYINEQELQENYLQDGIVTDTPEIGFNDFTVPENCIFAMGDNRNHSQDCRDFGCIPLERIESTVALRIWPLNLFGKVE